MKAQKKGFAFALILSLTLVVASVATPMMAFADASGIEAPSISDQLKGDAIVKVPLIDDQLFVTVNEMDLVLNISEETLVIDSKTGLPASLEDLKADDAIFVYYSAAIMKSLPPQSHAIAIVTQVEKNKIHAELFTVKEIISEKDGEIRALNKEGDLIVAFLEEISLTPFKTKQIVTIDDIKIGTQLFIWYDIVALSYPGQTAATKAVLVGQLDENGFLTLPLRAVAESLGFQVTWNGEERSVLLDDGVVKTTLFIGEDSYFRASSQAIGITQTFQLGSAPTIVDSRTYVPASFFRFIHSDNGEVK
ncbi:MAG: hypothetical protein CVU86_04040 [Firmicutes bacterium HGW-Firmicutes-11]|jgi:hypothetical protein|nr:MAG: hypothetical protein CVU86_04040 [Firmicutes bacterium HGW-Firmicutes-11]